MVSLFQKMEGNDSEVEFTNYLSYFCHITSVKGVSRITKSKRLPLRIFWFLAVTVFFGMAVQQVYILIYEFLQYPLIIRKNESMMRGKDRPHPPQVTVCNLTPFNRNYKTTVEKYNIPTLSNFSQRLKDFKVCAECSPTEQLQRIELVENFKTLEGYYQYIGRVKSYQVSHKEEELLIDCKVKRLKGLGVISLPCSKLNVGEIRSWASPKYFNCFHVYLDKTRTQQFLTGMTLTLFIDNVKRDPISSSLEAANGVVVAVDPPGTPPFSSKNIYYVDPGRWSHIEVKQDELDRLPNPYGICKLSSTHTEIIEHSITDLYPSKVFGTYSTYGCVSLCMEDLIAKKCECEDANYLSLLHKFHPNFVDSLSFCDDVSLSFDSLLEKYSCAQLHRSEYHSECERNCSVPCSEVKYEITKSDSLWPIEIGLDHFYDNFIKNRPYQTVFPSQEEWHRVPNLKLARENFIRLSVYLGDNQHDGFQEVPVIGYASFLSQLGGTLNLWSGITIVVLMEIVDLIYQIIKKIFKINVIAPIPQ